MNMAGLNDCRKFAGLVWVFAITLLLSGCSWNAWLCKNTSLAMNMSSVESLDENISDNFKPVIDEFRRSITCHMKEHNIPGVAIALVDRESVLWKAGFGVRDRKSGEPVTFKTAFSIQSISKHLTATAVMLEVQDGRLDLDATISDYLPDFTVNSRFEETPERKITLRQLLTHKAGFTHEAPVGNNSIATSPSFDAHVASISDTWLKFPVGERFSYSNLGIDIAGYILQQQSGLPFEDYMHERLFRPLGLTASFVDKAGQTLCSNCAVGHQRSLAQIPDYVPMAAAGGVRMSIEDAATYVQFHLNRGKTADGRRLFESRYFDQIYQPDSRGEPSWRFTEQGLWMGMSIFLHRREDTYMVGFNGGGFGYIAAIDWLPEYGVGVAVLTNSSDHPNVAGIITSDLLARIVKDGLQKKIDDPSIPTADAFFATAPSLESAKTQEEGTPFKPEWQDYIGTYNTILSGGFEVAPLYSFFVRRYLAIKIVQQDGHLYIHDKMRSTSEPLVEHLPGLFFGASSGEALDFRGTYPTWANAKLEKSSWFSRRKENDQ
jgi:CubicO group peptidase (beta-lactamase class C family)